MTSNRDNDRRGLGRFEEKLLGELKSVVAQRKAEQSASAPVRSPLWRRPRALSLASAGALAVGAAIGVPLLGGESTAPPASAAYTVTANDDGTVTVEIERWEDAEGLEAQLEAHAVPAEVDYLPAGKQCQLDRGTSSDSAGGGLVFDEEFPGDGGTYKFKVRTSDLGPDDTLVIENTSEGDVGGMGAYSLGTGWQIITGPVEECVPEDMPPLPDSWDDPDLGNMVPVPLDEKGHDVEAEPLPESGTVN